MRTVSTEQLWCATRARPCRERWHIRVRTRALRRTPSGSWRDEGPRRRGSQVQRDGEVVQVGHEAARRGRVSREFRQGAENQREQQSRGRDEEQRPDERWHTPAEKIVARLYAS